MISEDMSLILDNGSRYQLDVKVCVISLHVNAMGRICFPVYSIYSKCRA